MPEKTEQQIESDELGSLESFQADAENVHQQHVEEAVPTEEHITDDFLHQQAEGQHPGAEQQSPHPGQQVYNLPPGYAIDPTTGQVVYIGQPGGMPYSDQQPFPNQGFYVPPQPRPEEIAAMQAAEQQKYAQVVGSVEQFLEGEATVADVVKTMYANMSDNDNLWKGALVGAAAAIVLTSEPVKEAMGKTISGLFPGLKGKTDNTPDSSGGDK